MVVRAMGGRWTTCVEQLFCSALLIIVLEMHCCWSLNSEGLALFRFRETLEVDPFGALANWDPDDSDPCMWSGVECLDGNVVVLDLNGHDLEGALAPELGSLTHLRVLDLSKNHLSGHIPPQFGQLASLEVLDLRYNKLRGRVPAEIGEMRSLKQLLLCNNRLEGSMPVEIEKLSLLTNLQLEGILTSADAAGFGCTNRKLGHCTSPSPSKQAKKSNPARAPAKWSLPHYLNLLPQFSFVGAFSQNHADDSNNNQTDSPEQHIIKNSYVEVNNVRRVLVEQSCNLVAVPPNTTLPLPLEPAVTFPSRSSGSFPAVPDIKQLPPPPVPSQEDQPPIATTHIGDSGNLTLLLGILAPLLFLILLALMLIIFKKRAAKTIGPWKTGLSGQLQKAFVSGVPKLNRSELETACEDFSNLISANDGVTTLYKGTLSSGVEIAVASTAIASLSEWSKRAEVAFRRKVDSLSRVNHKNFVNLLGYCEEDKPFTRMMVFEYAPNGSVFEHLHDQEYEHLDWDARMRILMGTAYCLMYMHELNPPIAISNLTSNDILLTDDYAAKISDVAFWEELINKSKTPVENDSSQHCLLPPLPDVETNVYSFGLLSLEIITGKLPHSKELGDLLNWACEQFNGKGMKNLVDPALESYKEKELEIVCEVVQLCTQQDARKRPSMREAIQLLRQVLEISPEAATPRLSPLWWAELEILSQEAA